MNKISFPILNLNLSIDPVAFSIFGIDIYWYAIFIVSAMVIALIILKTRDGLYGIKFLGVLDLFVYAIPISLISARIYYCVFNLKYYIDMPLEILNFRTGGMAIYGGIIGGGIICIIYCKRNKIKLFNLLDYIAPVIALRTIYRKMGKLCKCRSIWI